MKLPLSNTLAALAAAFLAFTSIGTLITVPPAHAAAQIGMVVLA